MICAYIWHIYACGTTLPTTRCQQNILCKSTPPLTIQLCKSTPPFTFLIWLNMIYDAWTYKQRPNNAKSSTYTSTNNNVKVHLHLHWLVHQQLNYQVFRSTQSTIHNSNKSHCHIINKHQHQLSYIYINQHPLHNMAQQLHTLSHNSSKGENTTL